MATYQDQLNVRTNLLSVPQDAVNEIGNLWGAIANDHVIDFEQEIERIAQKLELTSKVVSDYYDWFEEEPAKQVVIFFNERLWLDGKPCFDIKYNTQYLPKGAVVCGIISEKGSFVNPPYIGDSELQEQDLLLCLQTALLSVKVLNYTADELLTNQVVVF